jgi:transcription elongation factor Elf1
MQTTMTAQHLIFRDFLEKNREHYPMPLEALLALEGSAHHEAARETPKKFTTPCCKSSFTMQLNLGQGGAIYWCDKCGGHWAHDEKGRFTQTDLNSEMSNLYALAGLDWKGCKKKYAHLTPEQACYAYDVALEPLVTRGELREIEPEGAL